MPSLIDTQSLAERGDFLHPDPFLSHPSNDSGDRLHVLWGRQVILVSAVGHVDVRRQFEHFTEHDHFFVGDETRYELGGAAKSVIQEVHTREVLVLQVAHPTL